MYRIHLEGLVFPDLSIFYSLCGSFADAQPFLFGEITETAVCAMQNAVVFVPNLNEISKARYEGNK